MVAPLVGKKKIAEIANQVDLAMLKVLRRVSEQGGVLMNSAEIDQGTAVVLKRLVQVRALDAGYRDGLENEADNWVMTGIGKGILAFYEKACDEGADDDPPKDVGTWQR